jgi:hypothetical protein
MRRCLTGLVAALLLVSGAQPVQAEVDHIKVVRKAQGAATKGTQQTYDWRWAAGPIYVYDGTGEPRWGVADAVNDWRGSGLDVRLSATPCTGCIDVSAGAMPDANWGGYAEWTAPGGYATECRAVLDMYDAPRVYAHHIALHEVGHCLALAHNSGDVRGSVMNTTVSSLDYVTAPSRGDLNTLATHYGL